MGVGESAQPLLLGSPGLKVGERIELRGCDETSSELMMEGHKEMVVVQGEGWEGRDGRVFLLQGENVYKCVELCLLGFVGFVS